MEQEGNFLVVLMFFSLITFAVADDRKKSETHHGCNDSDTKLFVFGDSFVDTGNRGPKHERYSSGLALTDFIASFLAIQSPVPYELRNLTENKSQLKNGMNFAYGGTGVFNRSWNTEDVAVQINDFKQIIDEKVYTKCDVQNSVTVVMTGGNDYTYYVQLLNGTMKGVYALTRKVVHELTKDLRELRKIGLKRVVMFGLPPRGCYPKFNSFVMYKSCNETWNKSSRYNDKLLKREVEQLNRESKKTKFLYVDVYGPTISAMKERKRNPMYKNPLRPCCDGIAPKYFCGMVDKNGTKLYTICKNPQVYFYWDMAHHTQEAVFDIYLHLLPQLSKI